MRENPGLAATVPVAPPLSRRGLRSWHPGKRPPGCKGQRRFANRASRRCGGPLPVVLSGAIHLFKPLSPGAKTATTVSASPGVKCTSRKTFCPKAGKNFCGLPPDSRFRMMRQQSHRLPVNSLNERIIFRKSECGQRAGIWAMMCPALEAFCLMT